MGRPRTFDEAEVVEAAADLFARRAYDGVSVDDLVAHLGVHRNSLYKVFGSKRGLYLAALRWHLEHRLRPLPARVRAAPDPAGALRDPATSPD
ncbi:TetR/AcrR family transcriptional regulator, partial [Streptomyces sp. Act-28]